MVPVLVTTPGAQAPGVGDLLSPGLSAVPVVPVLALALAAAYLVGALRLWSTGRRWSIGRTASFLAGCLVVLAVTGTGIDRYGDQLFSVFMFQQLTLMMAVPPLLVLGSAGTLLLRSAPRRGPMRWLSRLGVWGARSRFIAVLLHPAVGAPLYLLSFYGLYFGGIADRVLALPAGHTVLELVFLSAGVLFTVPILSSDPLPRRLSYPGRVADLVMEMALHAFFGVIVMISPTLIVTYFEASSAALGVDPLADQRVAGALAWSYGEGPTVFVLLSVLHRWYRDDTRKARARDRAVEQYGDADLDAYNAYLEKLQRQSPDRREERE